MNERMINNNIELIYDKIKISLKYKNLDILTYLELITMIMEEVENIKNLNGVDKKIYVIELLKKIISGEDNINGTKDDLIPSNTANIIYKLIEDDTISSIIETIIYITRTKLNINKSNYCFCLNLKK